MQRDKPQSLSEAKDQFVRNVIHDLLDAEIAAFPRDVRAKASALREMAAEGAGPPSDYAEYLASDGWRERRQQLINAHSQMCAVCRRRSPLHVHHRNYNWLGRETDGSCVVLCQRCHAFVHPHGELARDWCATAYPNLLDILRTAITDLVVHLQEIGIGSIREEVQVEK